jgi:hypothetical protein
VPDDYDPEAIVEFVVPAPPDDGPNLVCLKLREREDRPAVYLKRGESGEKVVAALGVRFVNGDGELGQFGKDFYPTSQVFKGAKASHLSTLCLLAGKPLSRGMTTAQIRDHVQAIFLAAGDEGLTVWAETRWIKSIPLVDETGLPVYEGGNQKYLDIKGQKRVLAHAISEGRSIEEAHLFSDPVSGEQRSARAEIVRLLARFEER